MIDYATLAGCIIAAFVCVALGFFLGWMAGGWDARCKAMSADYYAELQRRSAESWRAMAAETVAELREYRMEENETGGCRQ